MEGGARRGLAEGGDVVFILFVGLTTLCGISNFQANCGACPLEWKRFERNAASQYDSSVAHWLFVCGRDVLVVTSGATPYFLATYAGCALGPPARDDTAYSTALSGLIQNTI